MNHALGATTSLWGGITHPGLEQSLCFKAVDSCVQRADGAFAARSRLDLCPDGSAIGLISKSSSRGNQKVFKFAKDN
jgi:hypothetical protein